MNGNVKLNLGCGTTQPQGWINVDYSLGARLSKIPLLSRLNGLLKIFDLGSDGLPRAYKRSLFVYNLLKRFPWNDESIDVIYSSHTLEHFSKQEGIIFLRECHRVLRKNGIIRIVIPDLKLLITNYISGKVPADEFVEVLGVLYERKNNPIKNILMPLTQFPHKCMYDINTLTRILRSIGFRVKPKDPFESDIADIRTIESVGRTENAIIVEGKRV